MTGVSNAALYIFPHFYAVSFGDMSTQPTVISHYSDVFKAERMIY